MSALNFAIQLLGFLPELIDAGVDVIDLIKKSNDALEKMKEEKRDPLPEEWDELNESIEALRAQRPDVSDE